MITVLMMIMVMMIIAMIMAINALDYGYDYYNNDFIGDEDNSRSMKRCFELNLRINARANLEP